MIVGSECFHTGLHVVKNEFGKKREYDCLEAPYQHIKDWSHFDFAHIRQKQVEGDVSSSVRL